MATYKEAIAWIADNDDTSSLDIAEPIPTVTVSMIADLWNKDWETVVRDVRRALIHNRQKPSVWNQY